MCTLRPLFWPPILLLVLGMLLNAEPCLASERQDPSATGADAAALLAEEETQQQLREALAQAEASSSPSLASPGTNRPPASAQSLNPNISIVANVAAAAFNSDTPLQEGAHDPKGNGFHLQQLEMTFHSAVDPFFNFQANLVYGPEGVEIEEAFARSTDLPANLQLRAGQFLTRFGRLNTTHPHAWNFLDQPFFWSKVLGGEGNRGMGTELNWLAPLPWYLELSASLIQPSSPETARTFFNETKPGVGSPMDLQSTVRAEQFFPLSRDWALSCGLSAARGPSAMALGTGSELLGGDVHLKWRPLEQGHQHWLAWTTEFIARRRHAPDLMLQDFGGYSSIFWSHSPAWGVCLRGEWGQNLAQDPLDPNLMGDRHRYSAVLTHCPSEFSRIRLQSSCDLLPDRAPVYGVMVGLEWLAGMHGAHRF